MGKNFFSLIVFSGTEVPIVYILLCRPSEDSLQGNAIQDGSRSKDWQSTVGWGDSWIRTQDCSFTIWCHYQWTTTAPYESPLLPEATTAPYEPPMLPKSHHCSLWENMLVIWAGDLYAKNFSGVTICHNKYYSGTICQDRSSRKGQPGQGCQNRSEQAKSL
jgi:hypothetical protein